MNRRIILRDEHTGPDHRSLSVHLDDAGNLQIEGHDIGPAVARYFGEDEYEWFITVAAEHLPAAITALGGQPADDILQLLHRDWSGPQSANLEQTLRTANIPIDFHST